MIAHVVVYVAEATLYRTKQSTYNHHIIFLLLLLWTGSQLARTKYHILHIGRRDTCDFYVTGIVKSRVEALTQLRSQLKITELLVI